MYLGTVFSSPEHCDLMWSSSSSSLSPFPLSIILWFKVWSGSGCDDYHPNLGKCHLSLAYQIGNFNFYNIKFIEMLRSWLRAMFCQWVMLQRPVMVTVRQMQVAVTLWGERQDPIDLFFQIMIVDCLPWCVLTRWWSISVLWSYDC